MSSNEFWTNDDGLNIRFGLEKGTASVEGKLSTLGDEEQVVVTIDWDNISNTDAPVATHPLVGIPTGAHIISATFYVTEAFTGTSGTLDIGLWHDDGDGTFSVYDLDGIDAAIAVTAIDAIGDQVACDGVLVGSGAVALAGTGGRPLYVSAKEHASNAFTAGTGDLVIKYRVA